MDPDDQGRRQRDWRAEDHLHYWANRDRDLQAGRIRRQGRQRTDLRDRYRQDPASGRQHKRDRYQAQHQWERQWAAEVYADYHDRMAPEWPVVPPAGLTVALHPERARLRTDIRTPAVLVQLNVGEPQPREARMRVPAALADPKLDLDNPQVEEAIGQRLDGTVRQDMRDWQNALLRILRHEELGLDPGQQERREQRAALAVYTDYRDRLARAWPAVPPAGLRVALPPESAWLRRDIRTAAVLVELNAGEPQPREDPARVPAMLADPGLDLANPAVRAVIAPSAPGNVRNDMRDWQEALVELITRQDFGPAYAESPSLSGEHDAGPHSAQETAPGMFGGPNADEVADQFLGTGEWPPVLPGTSPLGVSAHDELAASGTVGGADFDALANQVFGTGEGPPALPGTDPFGASAYDYLPAAVGAHTPPHWDAPSQGVSDFTNTAPVPPTAASAYAPPAGPQGAVYGQGDIPWGQSTRPHDHTSHWGQAGGFGGQVPQFHGGPGGPRSPSPGPGGAG